MKTHLARPPCAWCLDDFEAHQHLRPGYDCARCECRRYIAPGFGSLMAAEVRQWGVNTGRELRRAGRWVWRVLGEIGQGLTYVWSLIRSLVEKGLSR